MTFEEIEAIVMEFDERGIDHADLRIGTARLRLRFARPSERPHASPLAAPTPGRFRPSHPLEAGPRFSVGDAVRTGDIVAFIEANGLFHPVVAGADLTLGSPLFSDGDAVSWGVALYETR